MSSCYKKNVNIEKYADPPRTPYDQLMNKVYSPQEYNAAPFPMDRTKYDMKVINKFAPNCKYGFEDNQNDSMEKYTNPRTPYDQMMNKVYSPQNYNAAPFPMDRTQFDAKVQKTFSPNCSYGFLAVPRQKEKNVLNPANIYKEDYCGGGDASYLPNNTSLALQDNDNVWSYNSSLM